MKPEKEIKKLNQFLEENDCKKSFYLNFKKNRVEAHLYKDPEEYLTGNEQDWIQNSFIWSETKEGFDFWCDIHKKYKQEFVIA